jgi:hypothetical protein
LVSSFGGFFTSSVQLFFVRVILIPFKMGRPSVAQSKLSFDHFGDTNTVPYAYQDQPDPPSPYVSTATDFPEDKRNSLRAESFQSTLMTPYRDTDGGNSVRSLPNNSNPSLIYEADDVRRVDPNPAQDIGISFLLVFIFPLMVVPFRTCRPL